MFVALRIGPRYPVEAELIPTMFGDTQIRVTVHKPDGDDCKDYGIERRQCLDGTAEAFTVVGGEEPYPCLTTDDGLHHCGCKDFKHTSGRESRPCRHLAGLMLTGLMKMPETLKPYFGEQSNDRGIDQEQQRHAADENADDGIRRREMAGRGAH